MLFGGRLRALVCLLACAQLATAAHIHPLWLRADATDTTAAARTETTATTKRTATSTAAATTKTDTTDSDDKTSSSSATVAVTSASVSATPTALFNITSIPAGQLPLQPELTPGWGVAGVLLLLTGVAYGLIGIRNQAVQTFFSAAYLGALGTTVLILYVLAPPVRPAVQGAYVVAAAGTGAVLGGLAVVFRDLTEGLGCLLGGFCLGMWLLCLRAGGLLHRTTTATSADDGDAFASGTEVDGTGTTVFLVAFAVGVYALSWTRWTRTYALIGSVALGGATAAVLGIDAFSRAGLKEFWVYVWHLNSSDGSSGSSSRNSLFPLATTTYPLTRGLRVELAATVLLAVAGVVSQLRLWRVVQARREARDAARADEDRLRQREEAAIGAAVEATTARARVAWAAVYDERRAHGAIPPPEPPFAHGRVLPPPVSPADSGVGSDVASEKRLTAKTDEHGHDHDHDDHTAIEMDDLQEKDQALTRDGPAITVRVVAEDDDDEGEKGADTAAAALPHVTASPAAGGPRIVPLPFAVPAQGGDRPDNDDDDEEDRSSRAATVAEEEAEAVFRGEEAIDAADVPTPTTATPTTPNRASLAKRLSHGSADLLRSLSQRSARHKRASAASAGTAAMDARGESQEALVSPSSRRASRALEDDETDSAAGHGRSESLVATLDGMSSEEGEEEEETKHDDDDKAAAETESAADKEKDGQEEEPVPAPTPAPLTKDRLPRSLSRVALSYRTNEWAKHLSHADAPAPEPEPAPTTEPEEPAAATAETEAPSEDSSSGKTAAGDGETPAPVDVAALQQTAATGAPPPAVVRRSGVLRPSASAPRLSSSATAASLGSPVAGSGQHGRGLRHEPIAEETDGDVAGGGSSSSGGDDNGHSHVTSPAVPPPVPGVASCTAPQSLLGQRDVLLRRSMSQQALAGGGLAVVAGSGGGDAAAPRSSRMMMHSASLASLTRPESYMPPVSTSSPASPTSPTAPVPVLAFNSHQPQRGDPPRPTAAAREAQLATFRRSVAADLRASSASAANLRAAPSTSLRASSSSHLRASASSATVHRVASVGYAANSRESLAGMPGTHPYMTARASSTASLAVLPGPPTADELDARRSTLLGQRDAEAQRRALQRLDQARVDRAFEERIRQGGDLLDAHREALRRMQAGAGRGGP